ALVHYLSVDLPRARIDVAQAFYQPPRRVVVVLDQVERDAPAAHDLFADRRHDAAPPSALAHLRVGVDVDFREAGALPVQPRDRLVSARLDPAARMAAAVFRAPHQNVDLWLEARYVEPVDVQHLLLQNAHAPAD